MRHKLVYILAPLASLALLIWGMSFFMTFISVKMESDGDTETQIGFIFAAYSAGLLIGAFFAERLVRFVGHIRAFASAASTIAVSIMIMGLFDIFYVWLIMRFLTGLCMAVQYVTIESWLLGVSDEFSRGRVLAIYMIVFYISQALSQFLIDIVDIQSSQAYLLSSIFAALAVLPVSFSIYQTPPIHEAAPYTLRQVINKSPFGFMGCLISGMVLGCLYSFTPVYAVEYDISVSRIMASTILGGILLQWPIGRISDHFDRRKILLILSLSLIIPSFIIWLFPTQDYLVLILSFFVGGISFTLYPLSTTEVAEHFKSNHIIAVMTALLFMYGLGSIIGPLVGPQMWQPVGVVGLFLYYSFLGLILFLFGLAAMYREKKGIAHQEFVSLPHETPVAYELDPRSDEKPKDNNSP